MDAWHRSADGDRTAAGERQRTMVEFLLGQRQWALQTTKGADEQPPRRNLFARYWLPHYSMYIFLVLGVVFAIGHHLYYRDLDGQDASDNDQSRVLRYGSALSFLAKASLANACG